MTIEGKTMVVAGAGVIRELDRRTSDGIDVSLLWHSQTNSVTVAVHDRRDGHRLESRSTPRTRSGRSTTPTPTPRAGNRIARSPIHRNHRGEHHEPHPIQTGTDPPG